VRVQHAAIFVCLAVPLLLRSQTPEDATHEDEPDALPVETVPLRPPISDDRILGIIPNFQTVSDPTTPYIPLRARDKWKLFVKETLDPYTFASAAAGAGRSQWRNQDPQYGNGFKAYMQRFGAAQADFTTQNLFSDALLASWFHEDPRYFREGPGKPVFHRIVYALSRVVVTRRDSGRDGFAFSGVIGTGLGIGLSNAYYPPKSVSGAEMESRLVTSFVSSALGNLLPEFWPDIKAKLTRMRHL
jgi:hypothetical protein